MDIIEGQHWKRIHEIETSLPYEGRLNYVVIRGIVNKEGFQYIFYRSLWKLRDIQIYQTNCIKRQLFEANYVLGEKID